VVGHLTSFVAVDVDIQNSWFVSLIVMLSWNRYDLVNELSFAPPPPIFPVASSAMYGCIDMYTIREIYSDITNLRVLFKSIFGFLTTSTLNWKLLVFLEQHSLLNVIIVKHTPLKVLWIYNGCQGTEKCGHDNCPNQIILQWCILVPKL